MSKKEITISRNDLDSHVESIGEGILYKGKLFSGVCVDYIGESGEPGEKVECRYKDGKADGFWTTSNRNGKVLSEVLYKEGKKFSGCLVASSHENGQKKIEMNYKKGLKDGLYTEWYFIGKKKLETHYKNGLENGLRTEWSEDGKIIFKGHFKDGNEKRGFFG